MIPLRECARMAGLESEQLVIGAPAHPIHWRLLSGYLANLDKGPAAVCALITADLRVFLDLGAKERAASVLVVLRLFLTQFPHLAKNAIPQICRLRGSANFSNLDVQRGATNASHGDNDNCPTSRRATVCPLQRSEADREESNRSSSA